MSRILIINPGSTSTKIAFYENGEIQNEKNLKIGSKDKYDQTNIFSQYDDRRDSILDYLEELGIDPTTLDAIACRGPGGGNFTSGAYIIDDDMIAHCHAYPTQHISSVGPAIAQELSQRFNVPAYVYDAEGVNEFNDFSKLNGQKMLKGEIGTHTLAQKAAAREAASRLGGEYEDYNLIVSHMGGGVSAAVHEKGKLVDSLSYAYTPERMGGLSALGLVAFTKDCFSGKYDERQIMKLHWGGGGLASYLGTSDMVEVLKRIDEGDEDARFYFDGMVYRLAQDIGAASTVVNGKVDLIVLTGGMAYSKRLTDALTERVKFIADVMVIPGSLEMISLARGVERVLSGKETAHRFSENPPWPSPEKH